MPTVLYFEKTFKNTDLISHLSGSDRCEIQVRIFPRGFSSWASSIHSLFLLETSERDLFALLGVSIRNSNVLKTIYTWPQGFHTGLRNDSGFSALSKSVLDSLLSVRNKLGQVLRSPIGHKSFSMPEIFQKKLSTETACASVSEGGTFSRRNFFRTLLTPTFQPPFCVMNRCSDTGSQTHFLDVFYVEKSYWCNRCYLCIVYLRFPSMLV